MAPAASATALPESGILALLHTPLHPIRFFDEAAISIGSWTDAWRLCRAVDENDVAGAALTLELGGELWTGNRELEQDCAKKGFTRFFKPPD